MNVAKISGDFLEKAVCDHLLKRGMVCMNPHRLGQLKQSVKNMITHTRAPDVSKLDYIIPLHADHFYVGSCVEGKRGMTSDVRVHNSFGGSVGISCKRNNMSIKHPSARALVSHIPVSQSIKTAYFEKYQKCVQHIYSTGVNEKKMTFKELGKTFKESCYLDLNENVRKLLKGCNSHQLMALAIYLLSMQDPNLHLLHWNDEHDAAQVYQFNFDGVVDCVDPSTYEQLTPSTFQIAAGDVILTMRLHNTCSAIKEKMNFQYDTRIKNFKEVCPEIQ